MIVNLSETASNATLDALSNLLAGGSIELLSGEGGALAVLPLSNPAAQAATGGELVFNKIFEGDATEGGRATTARILAADGSEIFSCDVGGEDSSAVIKLTPVQISQGAPVRIDSFKLMVP